MPGKPGKKHRVRVRTLDGKPRDQGMLNKLKSNQLAMPYLDIVSTSVATEFIICAPKDTHIEHVRGKLQGAGLEAIDGDTIIQPRAGANDRKPLPKKPYGFVALPKEPTTSTPIWHDGMSSAGRLSGEIRFQLETLTPLLVGWERQHIVPEKEGLAPEWPIESKGDGDLVRMNLDGCWSDPIAPRKSVLCPLRAPWGQRPVIIPGDSLKGLLRHELGALLGAPMERVAERSYSYRPNALFTKDAGPKLIARIARVPNDGIEMKTLDGKTQVRVPTKLELLSTNLRYDKKRERSSNYYRFDDGNGAAYRGGQGAGEKLNSKRHLHNRLTANPNVPTETAALAQSVQEGYLATVRHLVDLSHGHFSERHPDVPSNLKGDAARTRILKAARDDVFQPGDLIWVEWDTEKKCIVSLGWHYYYQWAYTDSVRKTGGKLERHGLFPLDKERQNDREGAPVELSAVRRLFGYAFDKNNAGVGGIGEKDHTQLMGRVFVNAGLEVVGANECPNDRFLEPTFLKELGQPRPSAVEHYLKQPHHPCSRPTDKATLVTYGDAVGYDAPGELAGRKFYLDREDAYTTEPWTYPCKSSEASKNRRNERSTLAIEASKPGRKFRFTVRFRDLDAVELAAVVIALCPDQFKHVLEGTHSADYCTKLGYARPLGWGSVRINAEHLLLLDELAEVPTLNPIADLVTWVTNNYQKTPTQLEWLAVHGRNHEHAGDYASPQLHSTLRAEHSRDRRYKKGRAR